MNLNRFSKKDLCEILDVVNDTVRCKTESDLITITSRVKDLVCADRGVIALGDANGNVIKLLNVNYPEDWLAMYAEQELYKKDPIIRYHYKYSKTHLWSEALQVYNDQPSKDLMNMASEFKLNYGLASGVPATKGSLFSFSSETDRLTSYHKKVLDLLTPHIHQALLKTSNIMFNKKVALSTREKQVLYWIKEGKTNWEISVILSISERTVKFHVQNILIKLDAISKTHAVAIAMEKGLDI